MFQTVAGMRAVGRIREMPPPFTAEEAARLAVARVAQGDDGLVTGYGVRCTPACANNSR